MGLGSSVISDKSLRAGQEESRLDISLRKPPSRCEAVCGWGISQELNSLRKPLAKRIERLAYGLLFCPAERLVAVSSNLKPRPRIVCGLSAHSLRLRSEPEACPGSQAGAPTLNSVDLVLTGSTNNKSFSANQTTPFAPPRALSRQIYSQFDMSMRDIIQQPKNAQVIRRMLAINYPEAIIEEPIRENIIRPKRPLPPHPGNVPGCPDSLHREQPTNQAAFHEWVHAVFMRVFHCEKQPLGPMVTVEAPAVKGLTVYGAKSGETRFYGARIERSGVFVGWMRIQPHIAGVDSDYAVGEVLQRPVFMGITMDLSGHDAVDKFTQALKEAAWDLGLAGG